MVFSKGNLLATRGPNLAKIMVGFKQYSDLISIGGMIDCMEISKGISGRVHFLGITFHTSSKQSSCFRSLMNFEIPCFETKENALGQKIKVIVVFEIYFRMIK
jgi:hypothetical protein